MTVSSDFGKIASVTELYEERRAGIGDDGKSFASRTFVVKTLFGSVTQVEVLQASLLPKWGDQFIDSQNNPQSLWAFVFDVQPRRAHDLWTVNVQYKSAPKREGETNRQGDGGLDSLGAAVGAGGDGGGTEGYPTGGGPSGGGSVTNSTPQLIQNPLLRPPQISWGTGKMMRVVEKDQDAVAITNKARLPFDPPIEREEYYDILTVVKNQARYDALTMTTWKGYVNNATWLGKAVRTWKVEDITATRELEDGIFFWKVTYVFAYRADKWDVKVLNAGTFQLNAAGTARIPCVDAFGGRLSRAVPLTTAGIQIAVSGGEFSTAPNYLTFRVQPECDFKTLYLFKVG